jgi:hypothetical protein
MEMCTNYPQKEIADNIVFVGYLFLSVNFSMFLLVLQIPGRPISAQIIVSGLF